VMSIPHQQAYTTGIFGLNNTGTLCYLNSLVQSLAACPSFVKTILDHEDEFKANPDKLGWELMQIFNKYRAPGSVGNGVRIKTDTTTQVLQALQKNRKANGHITNLGTNTQEDVFEGLKFIVEALDTCFDKPTFQNLFDVRYRQTIRCCNCGDTRDVDRSACPAEIMINMSESDPMLQNSLDTRDDVEKYINLHMHYPDDYRCEKCPTKNCDDVRKIQQFYSLARVSSILILSFHDNQQRLINKTTKQTRFFPNQIQIKGIDKTLNYRVVAQIEQMGSLGGGHYTAKCLRPRPSGLSQMRLTAARNALKDTQERLKICHNNERRDQYLTKIDMANKTIAEEEALMLLPEDHFDRQNAVFKFNDNRVNYDPYGFQPTSNTYLVVYHLF
jgi:ubiquitin C-terminal hydrolase